MNHLRSMNYQCKFLRSISRSLTSHRQHSHKCSTMLVLSESDVRHCLDMNECINVNRQALVSLATGEAIVPTRLALPYHPANGRQTITAIPNADDWTLFKPASLQTHVPNSEDTTKSKIETSSLGMKVVSIRADNIYSGHPLVPATIVHVDAETGIVDAVVAATYLTAVRTAAGSAIAIQYYFQQLQRRQSENCSMTTTTIHPILCPQHVVVFGAGLQAEQHIRAIACIFQYCVPHVTIINRNIQRAELLRDLLLSEQIVESISIEQLDVSGNSQRIEETILLSADVIVTCTNTTTPLWGISMKNDVVEQWSNRKCIIAGIGSYTPSMQEVPTSVVSACRQVWIDTLEAATVGDLKYLLLYQSIENMCTPQLMGSVLLYKQDDQQIGQVYDLGLVFYKAVGTAIQDILTADIVVERARKLGKGTTIDMS